MGNLLKVVYLVSHGSLIFANLTLNYNIHTYIVIYQGNVIFLFRHGYNVYPIARGFLIIYPLMSTNIIYIYMDR